MTLPGSSIEEPGGGEESAVHSTKGGARHEYWHNPRHLHVGVERVRGRPGRDWGWGEGGTIQMVQVRPEPVFLNVYGAQKSIPPAYVSLRAGTITLFLLGS